MESKIQSTFIPDNMPNIFSKKAGDKRVAGGSTDIFVVISVIVFAVSLALAGGVFLYDKYITTSAKTKSEQLQRERKLLEPATIRVLIRLDGRLTAASNVLAQHIAPSILFSVLQDLTLKSVYFKDLEYSSDATDGVVIKMNGNARTVNGVALQADIFSKSQVITNPIFSDLNLVSDGVDFFVTATIANTALKYSN